MSASLPVSEDNVDVSMETVDGQDNEDSATIMTLERKGADGASTQSLTQTTNPHEEGKPAEGTPSEKEMENADLDLDKDIDVMIESNAENGFIHPDQSTTISSIQIDLTGDSSLDIDKLEQSKNDDILNGNAGSDKVPVAEKTSGENVANTQEMSEKSFASSTDSSLVAEAVVKKVIDNAVSEFNSNQNATETEISPDREVKVVKADIKVGLFQYGGFDISDDGSGTEEEDEEGEEMNTLKEPDKVEVKAKDLKVGLFQYAGTADTEDMLSPEVIELDDNDDMNEEENREDILKLYGLEGLDPVSPKSASPSESGPPSVEENDANKVIDVQRDVYEPQTRLFSITKSSSSTDSTPRGDGTEQDKADKLNAESAEQTKDMQVHLDQADSENENLDTPTGSVRNDTGDESSNKSDAIERGESSKQIAQDVSPPLVQYEPVTDNGKFRIVKTVKEGGINSFATIRVGTSPSQSPRDTGSQEGQRSTGSEQGTPPNQQSPRQEEKVKVKVEDSSKPLDNEPVKPGTEQIDKDLIRELIARERLSDVIPTRDSGATAQTHIKPSVIEPAKLDSFPDYDTGSRSPKQMTLSELREPPREPVLDKDVNISPREATLGGEAESDVKPKSYQHVMDRDGSLGRGSLEHDRSEDSRSFERRYQSMLEHDNYYSRSYDRDRYTSEEPSRDISDESSRYPASYKYEEYESPAQRTMEPSSHQTNKSVESGVIPGFRTLQEQQAKWSTMFRQLESEHRHELRSQYDKHQANIKRLQQQMEHELQKQHIAIRKKLDLHKEALANMSPDRDRTSSDRRHISPGKSQSPVQRDRSQHDRSAANELSELHSSQNSKTWREIYREVRAEESDLDTEPSPRLQRALDTEFALVDNTVDRSRSSMSRPSPRGRSKERDISKDESTRTARDSFPSSYEESMSRSLERESRSKVKGDRSVSPVYRTEGDRLSMSTGTGTNRGRQDDVSPYVKELLDNLKDSQRSLRGLQDDMGPRAGAPVAKADRTQELSQDRPRAGVYSSPMPVFKGKGSKVAERSKEDFSSSLPVMRSSRQPPDPHIYTDTGTERRKSTDYRDMAERDLSRDSFNIEDILSSSERLNLREKHSKHLSDLRAYYEEELKELRQALSDSMEMTVPSPDLTMQSTIQSTLLEAENKHLLDKCKTMEDELEELYGKIRTSEQKCHGLEKRASEYAAAFGDSQAMGVQHRAHIEELQRYCRERDDLVNDLESKARSQEDGVKLYKKSLEEELELHRQDKIALQRITDKYESLDREYKLVQETLSTTESKLYDARTEIVELNRAMSKMELENKRLGRENDNLRHKVTQSLNLSTMHDSFGSPSSPRGEPHTLNKVRPVSIVQSQTVDESQTKQTDDRMPGFAGTTAGWNGTTEKPRTAGKAREERGKQSDKARKSDASGAERREKREPKQTTRKETKETQLRNMTGHRSSNEDIYRDSGRHGNRSRPSHNEEPVPVRDKTPPRPSSVNSQAESEISDYSPLLKAERELFKLRDMMRQAVAVKPSSSPPPPKLQKKFYGSERPTSREDYTPDLGPSRGRREQPSNHASVAKTKTPSTHSKSDRTTERLAKKPSSVRSEKVSDRGSKSKDRSTDGEKDRKEKPKEEDRQNGQTHTPPRRKPASAVNPDVYDSPTRFDINVNEDRKAGKVKKGDNLPAKQRNLFDSDGDTHPVREGPVGAAAKNDRNAQDGGDRVSNTLDMMRNGQFTTRPQWEDVFTSMAKPKPETQDKVKAMTTEDKIKERLRTISEMESRYDGLQVEKRQLESSINKIPLHGRVDRNSRRQKEQLEDRLDSVEKELGSLKMSLKRYNVLKTAG